jgi:hypothetical protein
LEIEEEVTDDEPLEPLAELPSAVDVGDEVWLDAATVLVPSQLAHIVSFGTQTTD